MLICKTIDVFQLEQKNANGYLIHRGKTIKMSLHDYDKATLDYLLHIPCAVNYPVNITIDVFGCRYFRSSLNQFNVRSYTFF